MRYLLEELLYDRHRVIDLINDPNHASLDKLLGTHEAWERCDVRGSPLAFRPATLDNGILFSMDAVALVQSNTRVLHRVASLAPSLVAVLHAKRCPIIASRNDSAVSDNDTAHCPFHAIRPFCNDTGKLDKVAVPARPHQLLVIKIVLLELLLKLVN